VINIALALLKKTRNEFLGTVPRPGGPFIMRNAVVAFSNAHRRQAMRIIRRDEHELVRVNGRR